MLRFLLVPHLPLPSLLRQTTMVQTSKTEVLKVQLGPSPVTALGIVLKADISFPLNLISGCNNALGF